MSYLIFFIFSIGIIASGRADDLLGKGLWTLISVSECPDHSLTKETLKLDVNKHKVNRSHDGISAHITISDEINESFGIYIEVCKFVDGGCKQYQVISDNMGKLCDKYAKDNVVRALKNAKFNSEYFPLEKGEYDLEDFLVDYCSLPSDCPYGTYEALTYLIANQQRVACLKVVIECIKCDDDDYCCDVDEE